MRASRGQERPFQNTHHRRARAANEPIYVGLSNGQLPLSPLPLNVAPATQESLGGAYSVLPFLPEMAAVDNSVYCVVT